MTQGRWRLQCFGKVQHVGFRYTAMYLARELYLTGWVNNGGIRTMIRLEEINGKNVWDILKLRVSDAQRSFVAPNDISIIEAYIAITHHGQAFPFGIYDDETPVGFCMVGFGADDDWEDAPAIAKNNYNLWRFMIDERHQGKGYGKAAMKQIMDYIASEPCGSAEYCWLSYEPENAAAKTLYASFGFMETGEWDGNETIAVLKL